MAYTGVFEAPKIIPSMFGLLTVVKPDTSVDEDKWVRGFSQEWETTPQFITNYDDTDSTSEQISAPTVNYFDEIKPFAQSGVVFDYSHFCNNLIGKKARLSK